ncbi:arginine-glutamic acid dipeptide repeats protein isoform X2 [Jatropha curcas]|uniref:arginine-glutamic acid dipeptide repeats protein isoform X2 n=1 Tax=Jatropha curcas TaxID=180498 RepID=UPI0005FBADE3|nr:arginine-glutamic acid dipeptide repeats protein isoform X2 [Jatropha curcas]
MVFLVRRGWSSKDHIDSTKFSGEKAGIFSDVELISSIDQKLKEHVDVLLHAVECLSARLSQMESRTRQAENTFDDLKESVEFSHGSTDRKLMELETILIEVQSGIKDLSDKQEISEAQLRLTKLCVLKDDREPEKLNNTVESSSGIEALSSVSQQSNQPHPVPVFRAQPVLAFSSNITNLPLQHHSPAPLGVTAPQVPAHSASYLPTVAATEPQLPSQLPQSIVPPVPHQGAYYPLPVSTPGTSHQQYVPSIQQPQPSTHSHQPYQPPYNLPLDSHLPQLPQVHPPFTRVNPQVYRLEEVPYAPSSQSIHAPSQPRDVPPLSSQLFNTVSADQPSNLRYSDFAGNSQVQRHPQGYTNIVDFYGYTAPTHNSKSIAKPLQPSPAPVANSGEISYSQLPTARVLQHAIPTASSVDSESSSGGSGNTIPVDDVVDKVVGMGFRRDLVRATVKKLTENGQSVDLNIVLDKLMHNG